MQKNSYILVILIPVSTTYVERVFSRLKSFKIELRNRMKVENLSKLAKILYFYEKNYEPLEKKNIDIMNYHYNELQS